MHGHQRPGRSNHRLAFSLSLHPRSLLQMSDEHSDCTFLASSIVLLSELDGWLPSRASVVQFHAGTASAFNVSIVLRRDFTLLRGSWSVETPSRIYSRLVDGASKGPNTRRIQVHNLKYCLSLRAPVITYVPSNPFLHPYNPLFLIPCCGAFVKHGRSTSNPCTPGSE